MQRRAARPHHRVRRTVVLRGVHIRPASPLGAPMMQWLQAADVTMAASPGAGDRRGRIRRRRSRSRVSCSAVFVSTFAILVRLCRQSATSHQRRRCAAPSTDPTAHGRPVRRARPRDLPQSRSLPAATRVSTTRTAIADGRTTSRLGARRRTAHALERDVRRTAPRTASAGSKPAASRRRSTDRRRGPPDRRAGPSPRRSRRGDRARPTAPGQRDRGRAATTHVRESREQVGRRHRAWAVRPAGRAAPSRSVAAVAEHRHGCYRPAGAQASRINDSPH